MSIWETVAGLCPSHVFAVPAARTHVKRFLNLADIRLVAIGERKFELATAAYAATHYGKVRHPAALNMGDCFAYACARSNDAAFLYKGNDFALTDLAAPASPAG